MMDLIKNILLSLTISLIVYADSAAGDEFYKFIGKDGVVHFSDSIPAELGTPDDTRQHIEVQDGVKSDNHFADADTLAARPNSPLKMSIDSTFSIKSDHNIGTGFFISPNGYAITCRHVIEDDDNHVAVFNDGSEYPIGVISLNEKHDLALIMVLVYAITPYLSIGDPFTMATGDRIFAVGNSLGLQATVTDGVFTGVRENSATKDNVVQFSAPINPGNSGGPLVNDKGKAIGVVSWEMISQNGMPVTGVGFAVPSGYLISEYGYYLK